ncbi:SHOCT domain-containing protein [Kitasatospora sp. NPDC085879]|uniref:SHOCT domain-containing protein n=1 Tax=Kitasatospora sp. NPDC085879 TaxID=3154769 RepID=UPI0034245628
MMYWNNHGMNGWGIAMMSLTTLLVLGLLTAGVVLLARYLGHATVQPPARTPAVPPAAPHTEPRAPETLLAERLARGEIDTDEYRRRLDALGAAHWPASG